MAHLQVLRQEWQVTAWTLLLSANRLQELWHEQSPSLICQKHMQEKELTKTKPYTSHRDVKKTQISMPTPVGIKC